jgi:hypothetical protein
MTLSCITRPGCPARVDAVVVTVGTLAATKVVSLGTPAARVCADVVFVAGSVPA